MKPTPNSDGKITVITARTAEELLHDSLSTLDHEEAWLIYLTSHHGLIGAEMISKGTLDSTAIDGRTVMRYALLHNAGAIILLHNHPSGVCTPSQSDIRLTDKIRQASTVMGIPLLDHIIVAEDMFYSFCDVKTYKHIH